MRHRFVRISTLVAASALLGILGASLATTRALACSPEIARQVRFLEGQWSVVDAGGSAIARSEIRRSGEACAWVERWSAGGVTGISLLSWNPVSEQWVQVGASSDGTFVEYRSESGTDDLVLLGEHSLADGVKVGARASFSPRADGSIAHRLELESGGALETQFDGAYVPTSSSTRPTSRRITAADPPDPPDSSEASPGSPGTPDASTEIRAERSSAPDQGVRAQTAPRAAPDTEPVRVAPVSQETARDERSTIEMASPMVLRIPLGPVEKLPEGYAWSSRDVARYVVDDVTIQLLRASQRLKRGRSVLEIDLDIAGSRFSHQLDLGVELLDSSGEVVAAAFSQGEKVGRSLSEQIQSGFVRKTLTLEVESERYARLFEGSERPELEITVEVR